MVPHAAKAEDILVGKIFLAKNWTDGYNSRFN
jgi:hypothetical protein